MSFWIGALVLAGIAAAGVIARRSARNAANKPHMPSLPDQKNSGAPAGRFAPRPDAAVAEPQRAQDSQAGRSVLLERMADTQLADRAHVAALAERAALTHAHILRTGEIYREGKQAYLVTETLETDLADILLRERRWRPAAAADLGRKVAEGLAHAHANGFVHGNLNPAAIALDTLREPKIAGFQKAGATPEARRSDVRAFGALLYHVLSGRVAEATGHVPQLPDIPADLDAILQKCTETDPAARYADGTALVTAFRRLLGEHA